eukprot:Gb_06925 [translate_table: standard]
MTVLISLLVDLPLAPNFNPELDRRKRGNDGENWGFSLASNLPRLRPKIGQMAIRLCKMGGDPVTTEPLMFKVDEEVRDILEKVGLLAFFRKLYGFTESISTQVVESWEERKVVAEQLTKFLKDEETFYWLQSGIARESLSKPWDRVAIQVMKYLTLEGKFRKILGYHVAILNSIRNEEKVNIPLFLFRSLEKSIKSVKGGKGKVLLHQGLLKPLFQHAKDMESLARMDSMSPSNKSSLVLSESEEEKEGPKKEAPKELSKGGEARGLKRKIHPQVLASSLAKCSRRSSRLQQKSKGKQKIVDSSEEDKVGFDDGKEAEVEKRLEETVPLSLPNRGMVMDHQGTFSVLEELRCHLKILNGLRGSLSSTFACINLLAPEILNYLKEVVNKLKEMGPVDSQGQLARSSQEKEKA